MNLQLRKITLPLADFTLRIDLEIRAPRTAIFGPSGAGKTSLLEIIAGWRTAERGVVSFNGALFSDAETARQTPPRDRRVGYVPQDDTLFPHLSVRSNVLYGRRDNFTETRSMLDEVAGFLQISHLLSRDVSELSRGEKQRVTLARTLLAEPRLLLLDEPLTGIDAKLKSAIAEQLAALYDRFQVPMLYVTHDASEARHICDEVLMIEMGEITARGKPSELL